MSSGQDDWGGVTDPIERKKRQSRLRQRAWRDRKRTASHFNAETHVTSLHWKGYGMLVGSNQHKPVILQHRSSDITFCQNYEQQGSTFRHMIPEVYGGESFKPGKLIPPLLPYSTPATLGQPPHTIAFPLSADHCLITLVQFNVIRAIILNLGSLSLLHHLPPGCRSSFGVSEIDITPAHRIPPDLRYTPLQHSKPPPFWINAIPFPSLRNNLIIMADTYDSHELLLDLGLRVYEGFDDIERCGFLVWGQPWLATGWEVSEGFVRRWGYLLKGCSEVIESTNYWRQMRGEERLIVEI